MSNRASRRCRAQPIARRTRTIDGAPPVAPNAPHVLRRSPRDRPARADVRGAVRRDARQTLKRFSVYAR
ncbi:hypothetical protein C6T56_19190 [Burkholderia multivorans]|nr:hypothetical protein C6T56_19190 [Burkholderia multivorans]